MNISIEHLEKFVFSEESRSELLKNLIPGTEQYFYFNCLNNLANNNEDNNSNLQKEITSDYSLRVKKELESVRIRLLLDSLKKNNIKKEEKLEILKDLNSIVFKMEFQSKKSIFHKVNNLNKEIEYNSKFNGENLTFKKYLYESFKDPEKFINISKRGLFRINFSELNENPKTKILTYFIDNCLNFCHLEQIDEILLKIKKEDQIFLKKHFCKFSIKQLERCLIHRDNLRNEIVKEIIRK